MTWDVCEAYLREHCNAWAYPIPETTIAYAKNLWGFCERVQAKSILEVGIGPTSVSGCTFLHWLTPLGLQLVSVDVDASRPQEKYRTLAKTLNVPWHVHHGDSMDVADCLWDSVDLLYIDGDHSFTYAYGDTVAYVPRLKSGGLLVIDDTNTEGVRQARVELEREGYVFEYHPHEESNGHLVWQKP